MAVVGWMGRLRPFQVRFPSGKMQTGTPCRSRRRMLSTAEAATAPFVREMGPVAKRITAPKSFFRKACSLATKYICFFRKLRATKNWSAPQEWLGRTMYAPSGGVTRGKSKGP